MRFLDGLHYSKQLLKDINMILKFLFFYISYFAVTFVMMFSDAGINLGKVAAPGIFERHACN